MVRLGKGFCLGAVALLASVTAASVHADQSVADFYKGKQIIVYIGYSAGGGYDTYARTLARHLGKHVPGNPSVVSQNKPGAGSMVLTNFLYNVAPKDGTAIGTVGRGMATEPLFGNKKAQYDATKFNWLGSLNNEVSVCVAWHTSPVKTFNDVRKQELIVGGTGKGADTDLFPIVLNNTLGSKFKIVSGYPGGNDILLAMERQELQGRCGWSWSSVKSTRGHWLKEKKINILLQLSLEKHSDLPNVPLVMDLAQGDTERQMLELVFARQVMGRPFLAPPDVPADRVAALRKAMDDMVKEPGFAADIKKQQLELEYVSGKKIEDLVLRMYRTPKDIVAAAREAVDPSK